MNLVTEKQHAHDLIDQLDQGQLAAIVHLLEVMADPVARALAKAPVDDEPITEEEARALDEARESIQRGEGTPHEEILREFGMAPR